MSAQFDIWQKEREQAQDLGVLKVYCTISPRSGKPQAILFKPKATKPFANYTFRNIEQIEEFIAEKQLNLIE